MKTKYNTFLLVFFFYTTTSFAQEDFSVIDHFVNKVKKKMNMPSGTAIAIVKDGEIIYQIYFGYADIKTKKKVDKHTAFYIASVTKPFFALSALLLEQKGDIDEATTMAQMFPTQKFNNIEAEKITVKHLLSHTSGIKNTPLTIATAYTGLHDTSLLHSIIAESTTNEQYALNNYQYTNVGYNILSVWFDDLYPQSWKKYWENQSLNH